MLSLIRMIIPVIWTYLLIIAKTYLLNFATRRILDLTHFLSCFMKTKTKRMTFKLTRKWDDEKYLLLLSFDDQRNLDCLLENLAEIVMKRSMLKLDASKIRGHEYCMQAQHSQHQSSPHISPGRCTQVSTVLRSKVVFWRPSIFILTWNKPLNKLH